MANCAHCRCPLGNSVGTSSIFGSHDVGDLCFSCWEEEDEVIEEEGTNSPERSEVIKNRLDNYLRR